MRSKIAIVLCVVESYFYRHVWNNHGIFSEDVEVEKTQDVDRMKLLPVES